MVWSLLFVAPNNCCCNFESVNEMLLKRSMTTVKMELIKQCRLVNSFGWVPDFGAAGPGFDSRPE